MFPPMSTDGVLGAAFLPTDGYIDPSQLTFALVEGARRRGAEICEDTRVTGIEVRDGAVRRVITDEGDIDTDLVVNAGGMFATEIGRLAGVNVPLIPMAHEYLITKPSGLPLDMPTMRDPSLLVYYRPESGGLIMGGYERDPAPWSLDGIPPDFNGKLLEPDWDRFEPLMTNAIVRTPSIKDARGRAPGQRPRGVHTGRRVHPRPDRGARLLGRGRLLRARPGRRGRHGPPGRGVDRRRAAEPGRVGDGLPPIRPALHQPRVHAGPHARGVLDVLRRQVPGPRAQAGRPLRLSPAYARLDGARARPSARSRAGSAPTGSSRTQRAATSRCGRADGRAACGRRRSTPSTGRAASRPPSSTSPRSRRSRSAGTALRRSSRACRDNRVARGGRRADLHADAQRRRRHRVRLHGDAARRGSVPGRHRHGVRPARPLWIQGPRPRRRFGARSRTSPRRTPASACGDRPRATSFSR